MNQIKRLTLLAKVLQERIAEKDRCILGQNHALDATTKENIELRLEIRILEQELNNIAYARQGTDETQQMRVN